MTSSTIRIGIIGAGTNTCKMHIPKLQALSGVQIVKVCNRSRVSSEKVAREFGIPTVCDSWSEIIDDESLSALVIGTWPNLHCLLTCAALHAGKHVLCEARMALNSEEAYEMLDTARHYPELVTQVVPAPFTLMFDQTITSLLQQGYIGVPYALTVRQTTSSFVDPEAVLTWRQNIDLSGFNTLTLGIWYESFSRWLGHASAVIALSSIFVSQRLNPETQRMHAIQIPDHLDVLARMACGAQAQLQFSAITGLDQRTSEVWLFGSEGTLFLDLTRSTLFGGQRGADSLQEIEIPIGQRGTWQVEEQFIRAIRGEEPVTLTTFSEAVKYMEFTEAVALSNATGRVIHLPLNLNL